MSDAIQWWVFEHVLLWVFTHYKPIDVNIYPFDSSWPRLASQKNLPIPENQEVIC
ncbi:hypothetical protein PAJ34TS1_22070 [Paenibacillus azoreducens]